MSIVKTDKNIFEFRPESPDKKKLYQFKSNLSAEDKIKIKKFFDPVNSKIIGGFYDSSK